MSAPADPFWPEDSAAEADAGLRRALLVRQLARLDDLIDTGMDMARGLAAQVSGGQAPCDGDTVLSYSRVARSVRMAILLQRRLVDGPEVRAANDDAPAARGALAPAETDESDADAPETEDTAFADRPPRESAERAERLERDSIYRDVLTRPVREVVADICRDLGIAPDEDPPTAGPLARPPLKTHSPPRPPPFTGQAPPQATEGAFARTPLRSTPFNTG